MPIKIPVSRLLSQVSGQAKIKLLSNYFNYDINNDDLYEASEVEYGTHGFEDLGDDRFASLYHIQRHIAKGKLKEYLSKFVGTHKLLGLSKEIRSNYSFPEVKVKYKSQDFEIQKYPYSTILKYYFESIEEKEKIRGSNKNISYIEFENFRRFKDNINLNIGDINFFVGPNNSGKSTVVKSILLLVSYLKDKNLTNLSLINDTSEKTNVVTFKRALNRESAKEGREFIKFKSQINKTDIALTFSGNEADSSLNVKDFEITLPSFNVVCSFTGNDANIILRHKSIIENTESTDVILLRDSLKDQLRLLNKGFHDIEESAVKERLALIDKRNKLEAQLKKIGIFQKVTEEKGFEDLEFSFSLKMFTQKSLGILFTEILRRNKLQEDVNENQNIKNSRAHLETSKYEFKREIASFENDIDALQIYHIGTNTGSQSTLLSIKDKQNPLAIAAHDYYQLKLQSIVLAQDSKNDDFDDSIKRFVLNWLGEENNETKVGFGIAQDIKVDMIGGEAYTISLKDEKGDWSYLADRGMGSVQLVLLILSIATIIKNTENHNSTPVILVEEPEINLHPALQSKLTNLFYKVNREFGIKFIIETHSEYIIRKSQLIGLKEDLFDQPNMNPFNVFYFDKEEGPYEMRYKKKGRFDRNFGDGFYDVVDDIALEIFMKNNKVND